MLKSARNKLKQKAARYARKGGVVRAAWSSAQTSAITTAFGFLSSVVILRTVSRADYGLFAVLIGAVDAVFLLVVGYNESIARFMKEDIPEQAKWSILSHCLYHKLAVFILAIVVTFLAAKTGFVTSIIGHQENDLSQINIYLLFALLFQGVTLVSSVMGEVVKAHSAFEFLKKYAFFAGAAHLLLILTTHFLVSDYWYFLFVNLVFSLTQLLFLTLKCRQLVGPTGFRSIFSLGPSRHTYDRYLHKYATPLTMGSIISYIKVQLPIIILGKTFGLESAANYSILSKLFKTMHKVMRGNLNDLTARLIQLQNVNRSALDKGFFWLCYGSFAMRALALAGLLVFSDLVLQIFKIPAGQQTSLLIAILGMDFLITAIQTLNGLVVRLSRSTSYLLYSTLSRSVTELAMTIWVTSRFGPIGAAVTLLTSRTVETIFLHRHVLKSKRIPGLSWLLGITVLVSFCITAYALL